jgi:hypothetical protein
VSGRLNWPQSANQICGSGRQAAGFMAQFAGEGGSVLIKKLNVFEFKQLSPNNAYQA